MAAIHTNFISDSWEEVYTKWEDFRDVIEEIEKTEVVYTHDADNLASGNGFDPVQPNLKIVPIMDSPVAATTMAQTFNANPDAVLSAMVSEGGTGLGLQMNKDVAPIGWSANRGMNDRAGLTQDGFDRHWQKAPELAARAYNGQFIDGKTGVTIIQNCGKIRAMNGPQFAYGKYSDILDIFEIYWTSNFPQATVQNLYISHEMMRWELNLENYKNDVFKGFPDLINSGYFPLLQFVTSNTAMSAFNILPALCSGKSNVVVPLCSQSDCIRVRHSASGDFNARVSALSENIIDSYDGVLQNLSSVSKMLNDMKNTPVKNAYNALLRTMCDVGMPKKQGMESAELFNAFYANGNNTVTAFDCFTAIMNAYSFFVRDNPQDQRKQFEVAFCVGKAAKAPYVERGNIPGDFSW